ncbi:MAG: hypothetical protein ABW007_09610 [Chitinophagaceae bacterium]
MKNIFTSYIHRFCCTIAVAVSMVSMAANAQTGKPGVKNIVIVHGAFADASGWEAVYHLLKNPLLLPKTKALTLILNDGCTNVLVPL